MPNWCDNTVMVITKTPQVLDDLLEYVTSDTEPFSLRQIVEPATDTVDGHTAAWGTKWEVDAVQHTVDRDRNCVIYSFYTAWSPPDRAIQKLSEEFPDAYIVLSYDEPGMDFGGYEIFLAGAVFTQAEGQSRATTWHQAGAWEIDGHELWTEEDMAL